MKRHTAPILAALLLLLPVLYVASYFALVLPGPADPNREWCHYRWGSEWSYRTFWPLEEIDRKLRPGVWETFEVEINGGGGFVEESALNSVFPAQVRLIQHITVFSVVSRVTALSGGVQ